MNTTKLTREETLRRWNASKETKRKMVEKLETLVRNSCLERGDLENLKQYMMEKVIVDVAWCDRNYGGSFGSNVPGAVVFTAPTFEALQKEAKESLEFHIEGLMENGEDVPEWLKNGDYEFVYNIIRQQYKTRPDSLMNQRLPGINATKIVFFSCYNQVNERNFMEYLES